LVTPGDRNLISYFKKTPIFDFLNECKIYLWVPLKPMSKSSFSFLPPSPWNPKYALFVFRGSILLLKLNFYFN
jgi:hypothetical protein